MEEEVKAITLGEVDKEAWVKYNLHWFEERYSELERSLTWERVNKIGEDLWPSKIICATCKSLMLLSPK